MTALCIRLEARSAAHRCFRAYEIAVAADLFGVWIVEMNYGRIGTTGRTKIRSFPTTEEAQTQVKTCLRKRASAPRRRCLRNRSPWGSRYQTAQGHRCGREQGTGLRQNQSNPRC
jgi:predicted DNA-binding WGR domain protein